MKTCAILTTFLLLFLAVLQAQPGEVDYWKDLEFGLFDAQGVALTAKDARFDIQFRITHDDEGRLIERILPADSLQQVGGRFQLRAFYTSMVSIHIQGPKGEMVLQTPGSLDSITYTKGEYLIPEAHVPLFSETKVFPPFVMPQQDLALHRIGKGIQPMVYQGADEDYYDHEVSEEECQSVALQLEAMHGGNGWAMAACPVTVEGWTPFDDPALQMRIEEQAKAYPHDEYIVHYFPWKHGILIRHVRADGLNYNNYFSISRDSAQSWQPLAFIADDFYAGVVYFPGKDQIALFSMRFILLSQDEFQTWDYHYRVNIDPWPHPPGKVAAATKGLALKARLRGDSGFYFFWFHDKPKTPGRKTSNRK